MGRCVCVCLSEESTEVNIQFGRLSADHTSCSFVIIWNGFIHVDVFSSVKLC